MLNGKMYQGLWMPRILWKKQWCCLSNSHKFLLVVENHGKEFYCMVLQGQEKHIWQKLVLLRLKEHFFQYLLQIWWISMLVNLKKWSKLCLIWQDRKNLQLYSLMKLTQCVVIDLMEKTKLLEEWKHNSWFKCRV